jgi:hypothetical protein
MSQPRTMGGSVTQNTLLVTLPANESPCAQNQQKLRVPSKPLRCFTHHYAPQSVEHKPLAVYLHSTMFFFSRKHLRTPRACWTCTKSQMQHWIVLLQQGEMFWNKASRRYRSVSQRLLVQRPILSYSSTRVGSHMISQGVAVVSEQAALESYARKTNTHLSGACLFDFQMWVQTPTTKRILKLTNGTPHWMLTSTSHRNTNMSSAHGESGGAAAEAPRKRSVLQHANTNTPLRATDPAALNCCGLERCVAVGNAHGPSVIISSNCNMTC